MFFRNWPPLLLFFLSLFLWKTRPIHCADIQQKKPLDGEKSYIVYMGGYSNNSKLTNKEELQQVKESYVEFLGSYIGSKEKAKDAIFYSYRRSINGFAARLDKKLVAKIAGDPKVVSIFENKAVNLHTTRSWDFLSLEKNDLIESDSLWKKANFGEDVIIGNIDSGVWPESRSFNDEGYGPIPSRWAGDCEDNDPNVPFPCNRKLIGARYFYRGFNQIHGPSNSTKDSPRDYQGHGTHTLSTAGGNFVPGASIVGRYNGTAKGGAPRARVAAYKVCWPAAGDSCSDADIVDAFDHAIYDEVDVISASVGGNPIEYIEDAIAIGSFHAVKNGIPVICSAGNKGPGEKTVSNVAPWIITVAASTLDREFQTYVQLDNGLRFKGESITKPTPEGKLYPLITGTEAKASNATADDALLCLQGTLDPTKVNGKILVCLSGKTYMANKGHEATLAGAVGIIVCNSKRAGNELIVEAPVIPAINVNYTDGLAIFSYINSTKNPLGLITETKTTVGISPAPVMPSFSSRGPNPVNPEILKPDITAPGVSIMAAYTEATTATGVDSDKRKTAYITMDGTSMSCPHVAGVVALLKAIHPDWSPAAIRSALMTTATPLDNTQRPIMNQSLSIETPFSYGAGHIRPNLAADPGLIYDLSAHDYGKFLCIKRYNETAIEKFFQEKYRCPRHNKRLVDFNYPSITIPKLRRGIAVKRRVTNVGGGPGTYVARIQAPSGISVSVKPNMLKFMTNGETKSFKVTFKVPEKANSVKKLGYVFGELWWSDGTHNVRSPLVVNVV